MCQQYNEFDPNCCQYEIINQAKLKQQPPQVLIDDQQIVEILSDEDEDEREPTKLHDTLKQNYQHDDLIRNNHCNNERDNQVISDNHTSEQHPRQRQPQHQIINNNQNSDLQFVESSESPKMAPKSTNLISISQIARQTSINSQHQYFIRRNSSRRMSSRRRPKTGSNGRELRQVRFQPIPQSIDISSYSSELESSQQEAQTTSTNNAVTYTGHECSTKESKMPKYLKSKHVVRMQQQMSKLSRQSKIHLGSAKPLTKKSLHHLSHLKKNFNKIKLKSINSFAHQIQQTITSASTSSGGQSTKFKINKLASNDLVSENNIRRINSQVSQDDRRDEQGEEEEDGWGSDFDEESMDSTSSSMQNQSQPSNGYLLEIGKSNCDTRAIDDVIQDQGISGQFKQLETSYSCQITVQSSARQQRENQSNNTSEEPTRRDDETSITKVSLVVHQDKAPAGSLVVSDRQQSTTKVEAQSESNTAIDEGELEDDDDEAELRSLEARQGFRQIRDKLSIILDQRLATYERSACRTGPSSAGCATSRPAERPQVNSTRSSSSSVVVGLTPKTTTTTSSTSSDPQQATTTNNTNSNEHYPFQEQQASPSASHEFDCQSHCSEASSTSGLDSNHSGHSSSQDSGHSTQHSGYSAIRSGAPAGTQRVRNDTPSTISSETNPVVHLNGCDVVVGPSGSPAASMASDKVGGGGGGSSSGSSGIGSLSPTVNCCDQRQSTSPGGSPLQKSTPSSPSSSRGSVEDEERRNRFLQNRLIINGKLESLFKSRVGGAITSTKSDILDKRQAAQSIGPSGISPTKSLINYSTTRRPASITSNCSSNQSSPQSIKSMQVPIDGATRSRLLQEQRQMSLKLRQKPRRKTAARALQLQYNHHHDQYNAAGSSSSPTSQFNGSLDSQSMTTTDNGSYSSGSQTATTDLNQQPSEGVYVRSGSGRAHGRDSLTKQLSMVCLRQLESTTEARKKMSERQQQQRQQPDGSLLQQYSSPNDHQRHSTSSTNVNSVVAVAENNIDRPKLAMSLRQLVKEVIDDCEKPNKLSSLTRSILDRSDSLSSEDLAASMVSAQGGAAATATSERLADDTRRQQQQQQQFVSSTSYPSPLSARGRSRDDDDDDDVNVHQDEDNEKENIRRANGDQQDEKKTNDLWNGRQMPLVQPILPHNGKLMANYRVHSSSSIGVCNISQQSDIMQSSTPQQTPRSAANQSNLYHDLSQILTADKFGTISTVPISPYVQFGQHLHQSANDISMVSSIGSTIDGLEYSRGLDACSEVLSQPASGHHLNRQQQLKASIGAYWKSLRDFSRFKLPKVKLINANDELH